MNSLKEAFSRKNMLKNLNFFGELNLGLILTAVGIVYFKNPNHFAFGGTSGLSILLADLFPRINVGGFMWIINLILVVLGFVFLGIKTMGWTIYSSFALSFFVSVCEWLYPVNVSMSGDAMLDLVFAVFLPALGAAIVFDIGASTGGTDIVALILAKYTSMEIGKALMVSDILIVLAAAWRFGMGTGLTASLPDRQELCGGRCHREHPPAQGVHHRDVQPAAHSGLHHQGNEPFRYRGKGLRRLHPPRAERAGDGADPPSGPAAAQLPAGERPPELYHHRQFQRDHRQGLPLL